MRCSSNFESSNWCAMITQLKIKLLWHFWCLLKVLTRLSDDFYLEAVKSFSFRAKRSLETKEWLMRLILLRLVKLKSPEYGNWEAWETVLLVDVNAASKNYSMTMHVSTEREEENPFLKCQRSHKFARTEQRGQATVNDWSVDACGRISFVVADFYVNFIGWGWGYELQNWEILSR